jgi:hypothetical protein
MSYVTFCILTNMGTTADEYLFWHVCLHRYKYYSDHHMIFWWPSSTHHQNIRNITLISKVVSSNPADGEAYSTQYHVIKFVSDMRQVSGFLRVFRYKYYSDHHMIFWWPSSTHHQNIRNITLIWYTYFRLCLISDILKIFL